MFITCSESPGVIHTGVKWVYIVITCSESPEVILPAVLFCCISVKHIKTFLFNRLTPREFNSYGSRRGNDEVMARGTFSNIRLINKFLGKPGPKTIHLPSGMLYFKVPFLYSILSYLMIICYQTFS